MSPGSGVGSSPFSLPDETGFKEAVGELDLVPLEFVRMQHLVLEPCPRGLKVKGWGWSSVSDSRVKGGSRILEVPLLRSYQ